MRAALLCLALAGCIVETFTDGDAGVVYECTAPDATIAEWCWDGGVDKLEELSGTVCSETNRWWPVFTNALGNGCVYRCPGQTGCNAKQGCYCSDAVPGLEP